MARRRGSQREVFIVSVAAVAPFAVGCSSDGETDRAAGASGSGATDPVTATGMGATDAPSPGDPLPPFVPLPDDAVCDRLLECADRQFPSQYGDFFPTFGPTGTCWAEQTSAQCREACVEAMRGLSCDYCDSPESCFELRCHPQSYTCVECLDDSTCSEPRAYCKLSTSQCQQCVADEQCEQWGASECPGALAVCWAGATCDFERLGLTVIASGLDLAWDPSDVFVRTTHEADGCGSGALEITSPSDGAFEAEFSGLIFGDAVLTVTIDLDQDYTTSRADAVAVVPLPARPTEDVIVELTAMDFTVN